MAKKTKEELVADSSKITMVKLCPEEIINRIGFLPSTMYSYGTELDLTQETLELSGDIADQIIEDGFAVLA